MIYADVSFSLLQADENGIVIHSRIETGQFKAEQIQITKPGLVTFPVEEAIP